MLTELVDRQPARVYRVALAEATPEDAARVHALISRASRPILIVGGECRTDDFRNDLQALVGRWNIPVAVTNKNQDQFSNADPRWVGQLSFFTSPAHTALFSEADLIVAIGSRMGDVSSLGFAFPRQGTNPQKFVHVYPDPSMIGRHFSAEPAIVSTAHGFVRAAFAP